jgi:nitroreductase
MFDHPAPTRLPVHDLVRLRFSGRAFDPKPVEREKLLSCLEAACWAPSSSNEQSWSFVVGVKGDGDAWERIFATLMEGNQVWNVNVPVLILACAKKKTSKGADYLHAWHDLGASCENLHLQAVALGLRTHPMGGFDAGKAHESLGLPENVDAVAVIALGYPAPPDALKEPQKGWETAPRQRKPFKETVFFSRWGKP